MSTALIVMTTHGVIRESMKTRARAIIPPELNITAIESMPLGICNVLGNEHLEGIMPLVIGKFYTKMGEIDERERSERADRIRLDYAEEIASDLTDFTKGLQREYRGSEYQGDVQLVSFTSSSNLYNIYNYTSTPPFEKEFLVGSTDKASGDNKYNWKINLFLEDGTNLNLFDICFRRSESLIKETGVTLSYILNCLKERFPSIKNLIILDLTCNSFEDDEIYLKDKSGEFVTDEEDILQEDPRAVRRIKRELMKSRSQDIISSKRSIPKKTGKGHRRSKRRSRKFTRKGKL
jgi:hypothetical protein